MNISILIPAFEPDEKLINLIDKLAKFSFTKIYVVDDGSSKNCVNIFNYIDNEPNCMVIHHEQNRGKGAALKTGMKEILNLNPTPIGCITVDADGQHLPEDILKLAEFFEKNPNCLVLGSRDFNLEIVPEKSRLGNKITSAVFKVLTRKTVTDTQTGLRAIPTYIMEKFQNLKGDGYEYEMNMLMEAVKCGIKVCEVPIHTVYTDQNRASHFNPIIDSFKIYIEIFKFSFSSLICSFIDVALFTLLYEIFSKLFLAVCISRLVSSFVNFNINRKFVFKKGDTAFFQIVKYYLLCIVQMILSYLLTLWLSSTNLSNIVIIKIFADIVLFALSYVVQHSFIFQKEMYHEKNI